MQEQDNEQHLKIIKKLVEKYGQPKTQTLKDWLSKYSTLQLQQVNSVIAKFQSFVGFDEGKKRSDSQIKMFLLIAIAAQKGKNLMDLKESHLSKYKKHSFVIAKKSSSKVKDKQEQKTQTLNLSIQSDQIKQSIDVNIPTTKIQTNRKEQQMEVKPQLKPKQSYDQKDSQNKQIKDIVNLNEYSQAIDQNPFKKKRSNIEVSKSPITRPQHLKVSISNSYAGKVISPSKPKYQNQLEQSISTKMEVINFKQQEKQDLKTPTFPMKSLEPSHNLFQSQIQISSRNKNKQIKSLQIEIKKFQKVSQGWSTVVKYQITTPNQGHPMILRRYSQFTKLHSYLSQKYKGVIIPELPPKQYLKGAIWAADNNYLNQRRIALEHFMNKILAHEVLGQDQLIIRFISDQKLQESIYGQESYLQTADKYFKTLLSVAKNTSQIKDYGFAYYSYMKSSITQQLPPRVNELYQLIKSHLQKFNKFKQYIEKIDIIYNNRVHIQTQTLNMTQKKTGDNIFKKQINQISIQFSEAKTAYDVFCKLKAQAKWYQLLYQTKKDKTELSKQQQQIKIHLNQAQSKLKKTGPMLENQMQSFLKIKQGQWKALLSNFIVWKHLKNQN